MKKYLVVVFGLTVALSLIPVIDIALRADDWQGVPPTSYTDAGYYYVRLHEIGDGHPFVGNPYFFEHHEEIPPAFVFADWLSAPAYLLGFPLEVAIVTNFGFFSVIFTLLCFLFFRLLDWEKRAALGGAFWLFVSSYLLLLRPVAMQVIFPIFILVLSGILYWWRDYSSYRRILLVALLVAVGGYAYTYLWQILTVMTILLPAVLYLVKKRSEAKSALYVFALSQLFLVPFYIMLGKQISHPFYWESMERIGLIVTHLPTFKGILIAALVGCAGVAGYLLGLHREISFQKPTSLLLGALGASLAGVSVSNVITGKELETAQHIERFFIVWLAIVLTFFLYESIKKWNSIGRKKIPLVFITMILGIVMVGYLYDYSPVTALRFRPTSEVLARENEMARPLSWLEKNVPSESVIWADPRSTLNEYIPMLTKHYVLFSNPGILHLMSSDEVVERFLAANYFDMSDTLLKEKLNQYTGVGVAYHTHRTHNRGVRICRWFTPSSEEKSCGELKTAIEMKGEEYFKDLQERFDRDIAVDFESVLKKYKVSYIISDSHGSPSFDPSRISGTDRVYSDDRFTVYSFSAQ